MDLIEVHMRASLPPSPVPSPTLRDEEAGKDEREEQETNGGANLESLRRQDSDSSQKEDKTPTKVLEVGSRL